ncbi:TPA: DUF3801 domain-containing protein [Streptococcus agalactiae]
MDQEQMMDRGARVTLETGKQLFQFLAYALGQLYQDHQERKQIGEQSWKAFNSSSHAKDKLEFSEGEVNLKNFQKEIEKSGVRFHFEPQKDGTTAVWFEAINREVIKDALKKTIEEIVTDPKAAKDKLMRKPHELTLQEQIAKHKKAVKTAAEAVKNKTKGKSI